MGRTLVWQVRSSEKRQGLVGSLGSEFGDKNEPNPGLGGSEFRERTPILSLGLEFGKRTFFIFFCLF